jgi:superfamily II DNA or RNA helicase
MSKAIINSIRQAIQNKTVSRWEEVGFNGYAVISMGVGKSKIIAQAINRYVEVCGQPVGDPPIVALVNSQTLRDSELPAELKKWGCLHPVKIACYQTAYKWKKKHIGLLLADELDFALSDRGAYAAIFRNNTHGAFLGLTGTMVAKKFEQSVDIFKAFPFMDYPLRKAHEDGILNPVKVWIHEVPLGSDPYDGTPYGESAKYRWIDGKIRAAKQGISNAWANKKTAINLGYPYDEYEKEITSLGFTKQWWESSGGNPNSRLNLMQTALSLRYYAKALKEDLLSNDAANTVILFAQLTNEIDALTENGFHGKNNDPTLVPRFNAGEIREIGAVKKVNRGVNFVNLNNAVIHSFNSSLTDALQGYIGRMVRLDPEKTAHVHFLVSVYEWKGEKHYCQNAFWLSDILCDRELMHLEKQIITLNYL